jgi:hypothetical protein
MPHVGSDRGHAQSGLSVGTLAIASASSLVAAVVTSKLWGGGTLVGAAVTPVIVALVSEGLKRPTQVIGTVREARATRYDPVAEGRRGLREGDLDVARPARPGEGDRRRVHRVGPSPQQSRRRLLLAVATGLVAFVLAGVLLTGSELVFGNSAVSSPDKRTTLLGGESKSKPDSEKDDKTQTTPTTPTETTTTETTTPDGDGTETVPPDAAREGTVPGAPPPEQTAPEPSPAPTPPLPAPEQTPQQPAPSAPATP